MDTKKNNKILFACHVSDFLGGAERSMFELVLNTKKHGYEPVVIVPSSGQIADRFKQDGIKIYTVNSEWWLRGQNDFGLGFDNNRLTNGKATLEMVRIIKKEKPFVCVSYTSASPWLAYAASICETPHIWQISEILGDETQFYFRLPIQKMMDIIDALSIKIFTNSITSKNNISQFIPNSKNSIDVIYPFVDQNKITEDSSMKPPRLPSSKTIISLVGNIQPNKGQLEAVKALAELKSRGTSGVYLVLVGEETNKDYSKIIREFAISKNIADSVEFIGYAKNPHIYTKAADIALVCSSHEAFGRITIEALSIGTPVVGSDADGTREIIKKDGLYGLLYEPGNVSMLADKMEHLINSEGLRDELSKKGKKYVRQTFTLDNNQRPFFDFIESTGLPKKCSSPLKDISIAFDQQTYDLRTRFDNATKSYNDLRTRFDNATKSYNDLINSKKWRMVTKLGLPLEIYRGIKKKIKSFVKDR